MNIANVKIDGDGASMSFDSKVGLALGAFANFRVNEEFAFQPELLYSQFGAKSDGEALNLNYLSIPLMAKYYFGGFNIQAGPQIGMLMSAKVDGEDVKDSFKGMDFGLNIGAGYDLENGLGFDARYNFGLANIAEEVEDGTKMLNKGFQLTMSYSF